MDAGSVQSVIASRLPQRARWLIGNATLDFSLHSEPCSLAAEFAKWGFRMPMLQTSSSGQISSFLVCGTSTKVEEHGLR